MKVDGAVLDAWCILLEDEDPVLIAQASKFICKNSDSSFMPTPSAVIQQARKLSAGEFSTAEEAWARGIESPQNSIFDNNIWRLWGGSERWGSLPDPKYCDDFNKSHQILSFARQEFIQLFQNTTRTQAMKKDFITHSDANRFLEEIKNKAGFSQTDNIKKVGV